MSKIARGRMAFPASAGAVEKVFARGGAACQQPFEAVVFWQVRGRHALHLTEMQERGDIDDLRVAQVLWRHAFIGPAVENNRTDQIPFYVVRHESRTHQIRSASDRSAFAVAERAVAFKGLLTLFYSGRRFQLRSSLSVYTRRRRIALSQTRQSCQRDRRQSKCQTCVRSDYRC